MHALRRALAAPLTFAIALTSLAVFPTPAYAAAFAVDSTVDAPDANPGDGSCATADGACTLRAAVMEASAQPGDHTITLPARPFSLASELTIVLSNATDTLTIVGGGMGATVIDGGATTWDATTGTTRTGNPEHRLIQIARGSLTVRDLTMSGGSSPTSGGGAILATGTSDALVVERVEFLGNLTGSNGGAILAAGASAEVRNSRFLGNSAAGNGGAATLFSQVSDLVIDSHFEGNGQFTTQPGRGGALQLGKDGTVLGTSFIGNASRFHGGGLNVGGGATLLLQDSYFQANTSGNGGALSDDIGSTSVTVTDSEFIGNAASDGGAMYLSGGDLQVFRTRVHQNSASNLAGGIGHFFGDASLLIFDSSITENTAPVGGGVFSWADTDPLLGSWQTYVISSSVIGNVATTGEGGGVYARTGTGQPPARVLNSTVAFNTAAGDGQQLFAETPDGMEALNVIVDDDDATGSLNQCSNVDAQGGVVTRSSQCVFTSASGSNAVIGDILDRDQGTAARAVGGGHYGLLVEPGLLATLATHRASCAGESDARGLDEPAACIPGALQPGFVVNTELDGPIGPIDGVCDDGGGLCSLREAIAEVDAAGSAREIQIALPLGSNIDLANANGDLDLTAGRAVVVSNTQGGSSQQPVSQLNADETVFHLDGGALELAGMHLQALIESTTRVGMLVDISSGSLAAWDTDFTDAGAFRGGAIYSDGGRVELHGGNFLNNASFIGGAIFAINQSTVILDRVIFEANFARVSGGAVYVASGSSLNDRQGAYRNNVVGTEDHPTFGLTADFADARGGAITIDDNGAGLATSAVLRGSEFSTNSVGQNASFTVEGRGGAVYAREAYLTIEPLRWTGPFPRRTQITGNTSSSSGGGVYVVGTTTGPESLTTVSHTDIIGNTALSSNGGGLAAGADTAFTITRSTITGNQAQNSGGGIGTVGARHDVRLARNTVTGNTAVTTSGGGAFLSASTLLGMWGNTWQENVAGLDGGGVHLAVSSTIATPVEFELFDANTASRHGGGVSTETGNLRIVGSQFTSNTATNFFGGGVYAASTGTQIQFTDFIGNITELGAGGAVYAQDLDLRDGDLTGNTTGTGGSTPGVRLTSGTLANLTFTGNVDGGPTTNGVSIDAPLGSGRTLIIDSVTVTGSNAATSGAVAVSVSGTDGDGSAEFLAARQLTVSNNLVAGLSLVGVAADLDGLTVRDNTSTGALAGGVSVSGTVAATVKIGRDLTAAPLEQVVSQITGNEGDRVGGLLVDAGMAGTTLLEGVELSGNKATAAGGALLVGSGPVTFSEARLTGNIGENGSAILADAGTATISLLRSVVRDNTVANTGTILLTGTYAGLMTIEDTSVINNVAQPLGGTHAGIWHDAGSLDVIQATVIGNVNQTAGTLTQLFSQDGGAPGYTPVAVSQSLFDENDGVPGCFGTEVITPPVLVSNGDGDCAPKLASPADTDFAIPALDVSGDWYDVPALGVDRVAVGTFYCTGVDQIGTTRPQGGGCDVGAIESLTVLPATVTTTISVSATATSAGASAVPQDGLSATGLADATANDGTTASTDLIETPIKQVPIKQVDLEALPIKQVPIKQVGDGPDAVIDDVLGTISLNELPLTEPLVVTYGSPTVTDTYTSWEQVLPLFSTLAGRPLHMVSLADLLDAARAVRQDLLSTGPQIALATAVESVPLDDLELVDDTLGSTPLFVLTIADTPIKQVDWSELLDAPDGTSSDQAFCDWYALHTDYDCADLGYDPATGTGGDDVDFLDITISGAPIKQVPIKQVNLNDLVEFDPEGTPIKQVPIKQVPIKQVDLLGTPIGELPIKQVPIKQVEVPVYDADGELVDDGSGGYVTEPLADVTLDRLLGAEPQLTGELTVDGTPIKQVPIKQVPIKQVGPDGTPIKQVDISELLIQVSPIKQVPIKQVPIKQVGPDGTPIKQVDIDRLLIDNTQPDGTPIKQVFVDGVPIKQVPIKQVPIKQVVAAVPQVAAQRIDSITLVDFDPTGTPIKQVDLAFSPIKQVTPGSPLAGLLLSELPAENLSLILECGEGSEPACPTTGTLGDHLDPAAAIGVRDDAALWMLFESLSGDQYTGEVTLGDVVDSLPADEAFLNSSEFGQLDVIDATLTDVLNAYFLDMTLGELAIVLYGEADADFLFAQLTLEDIDGFGSLQLQDLLDILGDVLFDYLIYALLFADVTISLLDYLLSIIPPDQVPFEQVELDDGGIQKSDPNAAETAVTYTLEIAASGLPNGSEATVSADLGGGSVLFEEQSLVSTNGTTQSLLATDVQGSAREPRFTVPIASNATTTLELTVSAPLAIGTQSSTFRIEVPAIGYDETITSDLTVAQEFEVNDTLADVRNASDPDVVDPDHGLVDGTLYLSHIADGEDVDLFQVRLEEGQSLSVYLGNIPDGHNYDLRLYGPADTNSVGLPSASGSSGDGYEDDIHIIDGNVPIVATSAGIGSEDERIDVIAVRAAGIYTVQVTGYNGDWSPDPYSLRARTFAAPNLVCPDRETLAGWNTPDSLPASPFEALGLDEVGQDTRTLFLLNRERFAAAYGTTALSAMEAALVDVATYSDGDPSSDGLTVGGAVIDLNDPSYAQLQLAYDAWDLGGGRCRPEAANDVATEISVIVDDLRALHPDIDTVSIIGADDQVPFFRIPDLTEIANERTYDTTFAGQDADELVASLAYGYFLSDNPYADANEEIADGRTIAVPEIAIGRLVETAEQITAQLEQFVDFDGRLEAATARSSFVSGYDFLTDGAIATADALGTPAEDRLINETWTSDDVRAALAARTQLDVLSLNAHYDHYRALSAAEDDAGTQADLYEATEAPDYARLITFSVGCHSSLNVSNVSVGNGVTTDWAETWMENGAAVYAGNTGFGYGDTEVVAYSEQLMTNFASLLDGSVSVGAAMAFAKSQYAGDWTELFEYHEKVVQEATFYGLPMWRIGGQAPPAPQRPANPPGLDPGAGLPAATASFDADENPFVQRSSVRGDGTYFVIEDGEGGTFTPQISNGQPLQPRFEQDVTAYGLNGAVTHDARGVVIESFVESDQSGSIDPVIATATIESSEAEPELGVENTIFPSSFARVTRSQTPYGPLDRLQFVAGQFTGSSDEGDQLLFSDADFTVYYSEAGLDPTLDTEVPQVERASATTVGDTAAFRVRASDDTAVIRTAVLYRVPGTPTWDVVDLDESDTQPGIWTGSVVLPGAAGEDVDFLVQVVDTIGRVGTSSAGGVFHEAPVTVDEEPDPAGQAAPSFTGTQHASGWYTSDVTVTIVGDDDGDAELYIDGEPTTYDPAGVTVSGTGVYEITVLDENIESTRFLRIDVTAPEVEFLAPTDGAVVLRDTQLETVVRRRDAGSGIATEDVPAEAPTDQNGPVTLTASVTDQVGNTTTVSTSYRVIDLFALNQNVPVGENFSLRVSGLLAGDSFEMDWRDGSPVESYDVTADGSVTVSHVYTEADLYRPAVSLNGTPAVEFLFAIVYDPDSGHVNGAGEFYSGAGALTTLLSAQGDASFAFNALYTNGKAYPVGKTSFEFVEGDLDFKSKDYEWLIVDGGRATFQGTGELNEVAGYGFAITGIDAENKLLVLQDKVRVQIWTLDDSQPDGKGVVIYDNGYGAALDEDAGSVLTKGDIRIHGVTDGTHAVVKGNGRQ